MITKQDNPCYKCTERKAMCHIGCKRAKEYEEQRKARKEKFYRETASEREMRSYQYEKKHRYMNYKKGTYWGK